MNEIHRALEGTQRGDPHAGEHLLPLLYEELRALSRRLMASERPGQTLQSTALVHEAWLRLANGREQMWENRAHFFGAAAEAMRRILVDRARSKAALRHGGGQARVVIDEVEIEAAIPDEEILAVHEALDRLAEHDARKAELVKLRYFAGREVAEAAQILGISEATAHRDWNYAKAWLYREIHKSRT